MVYGWLRIYRHLARRYITPLTLLHARKKKGREVFAPRTLRTISSYSGSIQRGLGLPVCDDSGKRIGAAATKCALNRESSIVYLSVKTE